MRTVSTVVATALVAFLWLFLGWSPGIAVVVVLPLWVVASVVAAVVDPDGSPPVRRGPRRPPVGHRPGGHQQRPAVKYTDMGGPMAVRYRPDPRGRNPRR